MQKKKKVFSYGLMVRALWDIHHGGQVDQSFGSLLQEHRTFVAWRDGTYLLVHFFVPIIHLLTRYTASGPTHHAHAGPGVLGVLTR